MPVSPEALAQALTARPHVEHPALPGRRNHLRAGVLVPLRWTDGHLEALATLRPRTLRRHAGEVSFPGGRPEPTDPDIAATALRETREELGLSSVRILGRLSSMPVYTSDFRLEPFVGEVAAAEPMRPDPGEVEEVLPIDLGEILAGGVLEGIAALHEGEWLLLPIFRPGGHVMYGATALVLWELLGVLAEAAGTPAPEVHPGELTWERLFAERADAGRTRRG